MKYTYTLIIFTLFLSVSFAQKQDSLVNDLKNGITKPSTLSTHPFGIFTSRLQANFKKRPVTRTTLQLNIESGNVWAPPVVDYFPLNESDRDFVRQYDWHRREFLIDTDTIPTESIELQLDGVIKGFRAYVDINLGKAHELRLGLRSFMLTNGKFPVSIFTSDDFIEWFHKNFAGGDDPFDRGLYPYNKGKIRYKDRNNRVAEINNGDFMFGGIETSYYYYPNFLSDEEKQFYTNFGVHLGTNLSKFNSSIDLGVSANAIKTFTFNHRSYGNIGIGFGINRKNAIDFKSDNIEFGNNAFLGHLESAVEYNFVSKGKTTHSFGLDFYIQTSFNKKSEYDYIIPTKNGTSFKAWNTGVSNLYRNNNYWTLMYSFTRRVATTFYLQQDFTVNNSPDIQAGISVSVPF